MGGSFNLAIHESYACDVQMKCGFRVFACISVGIYEVSKRYARIRDVVCVCLFYRTLNARVGTYRLEVCLRADRFCCCSGQRYSKLPKGKGRNGPAPSARGRDRLLHRALNEHF